MGFFATRSRAAATADPEARRALPEVQGEVPPHLEAVGEALASGSGSIGACEAAGATLATDGASLDEALAQLHTTALAVLGTEPTFDDVRALSRGWSETALAYLHQLSCEDPLTGLSSLAHIRSRLSELYRAAPEPCTQHALVVLDLPDVHAAGDSFTRAMRMARLGDVARTVFAGGESVGRCGAHRLVVLAGRDERLGRRVALLRTMVTFGDRPARIWIEGLPPTDEAAGFLLDELCRA